MGNGLLTIADSSITHSMLGGAVAYFAGFAPGVNDTMTVSGSTFADNSARATQSFAEGGAIQITRKTHDLVGKDYQCEAKGTIDVKGADRMEVWHVIGRKAAAA
jgi:class 3 adenylate cyclase